MPESACQNGAHILNMKAVYSMNIMSKVIAVVNVANSQTDGQTQQKYSATYSVPGHKNLKHLTKDVRCE